MKTGGRMALYRQWALLLLAGVLIGWWLLPSGQMDREQLYELWCQDNLREIGRRLTNYAADHQGQYPADLESLALPTDLSHCPASRDHATAASYRYRPPRPETAAMTAAAALPVVIETPGRHEGVVHILFLDGHVESRPAAEPALLPEQLGLQYDYKPELRQMRFSQLLQSPACPQQSCKGKAK